MNIRIIILIFFLISLKTFGQEDNRWIYYFMADTGTKDKPILTFYTYDSETLVRNTNNTVLVWVKGEPIKPYYDSDYGKYVEKEYLQLLIDCNNRKIGTMAYIYYFDNGTMDSDNYQYAEMNIIFPESMGEALYKELCK